jgi:hypothetical protein
VIRRLLPILLCLSLCGCGTSQADYVSTLKALRGTSYWSLQCSAYITAAKHFNRHCGAADFFHNGCGGALETVAVVPSIKAIPVAELHPGDVIAINGVHVAAYVGDGKFMDSDPVHGGVDEMTPNAIHGDTWFSGQVKILRWKS